MSQAHSGHAGHMPSSGRGMVISAWLTGIYFVIEMGIGLWTGSIAVISDASSPPSLPAAPPTRIAVSAGTAPRLSERSSMAASFWAWRSS